MILAHEDVRVVVDPFHGARTTSLCIAGTEFLVGTPATIDGVDDPLSWGMYPMAPYAGRVRGARLAFQGRSHALRMNAAPHSIHGTVFDAPWSVVLVTDTVAILECGLGPDWPFAGLVRQYIGVNSGAVSYALEVEAHQPMPAHVGWHPWFVPDAQVSMSFDRMHVRDHEGIPGGECTHADPVNVDDCFSGVVPWPTVCVAGVCVELHSDCTHWVIYDQSSRGICIEPQSGAPNAVNDDPVVIDEGDTFVHSFDIVRVRR